MRVLNSDEGGDWNHNEMHEHGEECEKVLCSNQYNIHDNTEENTEAIGLPCNMHQEKPTFNCNPESQSIPLARDP